MSWVGLQCVIVVFHDYTPLLFFNDFCFKKVGFLKADIIIGLTEIKRKYKKDIIGHIHSSLSIQHNWPDFLL